jgi:hypothetical protein
MPTQWSKPRWRLRGQQGSCRSSNGRDKATLVSVHRKWPRHSGLPFVLVLSGLAPYNLLGRRLSGHILDEGTCSQNRHLEFHRSVIRSDGVLAALFLIDLENLSATYKKWSRDGWFVFVQLVVLGFSFAVANRGLTLFRKEALPIEYLLVVLILAPVCAWLVSRKKKGKGKRFSDVDALLKKKD